MSDYLEKFEKMRVAGNLAARTLDMLQKILNLELQLIILIS